MDEEIRRKYNLPRHMRNVARAEHDAVIELTPGGPVLSKRKMRSDAYGYDWQYAGDVREDGGEYVVVLAAPYNPETESDVEVIGRFPDADAAIDKLWSLRLSV